MMMAFILFYGDPAYPQSAHNFGDFEILCQILQTLCGTL